MWLILLVVSLGIDTFAMSVGLGAGGLQKSRWLRVGIMFALFEGAMPIVGLLLGAAASRVVGQWGDRAAGVVLLIVGAMMMREAIAEWHESPEELQEEAEERAERAAHLHGLGLVGAGAAVSIDELAAGFGVGLSGAVDRWLPIVIGAQAFALTMIGLYLGGRLSARFAERAEGVAGAVLLVLGLLLLFGMAM